MTSARPIGIFDSGIGGLSVANRIREALPSESLLYVADSAHAPYGEKPDEHINERASFITEFLLNKQAKAIVIACNTATAAAIKNLRSKYNIPIIGVEPGVKPAVFNTSSGVIGVLATTQTLRSIAFNDLAKNFSADVDIVVQPCPGLMEQVEALSFDNELTTALIRKYVQPLVNRQADTIVLGCTHYAFLAPAIQAIAGPDVNIINTDIAIANETSRRLLAEDLLCTAPQAPVHGFWSSGDLSIAREQFRLLWGKPVDVSAI
jgi:glutamate racemase